MARQFLHAAENRHIAQFADLEPSFPGGAALLDMLEGGGSVSCHAPTCWVGCWFTLAKIRSVPRSDRDQKWLTRLGFEPRPLSRLRIVLVRIEPEHSALDRSAILPFDWMLIELRFDTYDRYSQLSEVEISHSLYHFSASSLLLST